MLGYISYPVQAFVPNTLRCYRCQAYGHVAAVCRREDPRCEKCAEGHETKECVALGKVVVCVNCSGAHQIKLYLPHAPNTTEVDFTVKC
ncbi:unnamed protein product [Oncorhynchus mykiss]|uniref:CCHC-type domain-containing protein n=1 Tax=Oncorhynchus mykiss TaxID=8022 RepID=A0A060VRX2_ONCMY|nr:unnamed protein product [Oncorhynchus mykiss]